MPVEPQQDGYATEPGGYRNGLAEVAYEYRARRYPWAQRAIAAAEAEHGKPFPACGRCGAKLVYNGGFGRCLECAA